MNDRYFLIFEVQGASADDATETLRHLVSGDPDALIADDVVGPGDPRLIGWPAWNDISDSFESDDDDGKSRKAEPGSILLATITMLGTPMHFGAIRVTSGEYVSGELYSATPQMASDPAVQDELEKVFSVYDTALQITEIDGYEGEYVLYATPHGA